MSCQPYPKASQPSTYRVQVVVQREFSSYDEARDWHRSVLYLSKWGSVSYYALDHEGCPLVGSEPLPQRERSYE